MFNSKWYISLTTMVISEGVFGSSHLNNPTGHTMTLAWNKHLTDMSKGKAIALQVWTGPEDSRRLRLPDFKTIGT
jgi:hypothetical protein